MLALLPNVHYPERELVKGLSVSKRWLREVVGGLLAGRTRMYLGARVLECLQPAIPSSSMSVLAPPTGTPAVTSKAKAAPTGGGRRVSPSARDEKSLRAQHAEWRRSAPPLSPLKRTV